MPGLVVHMTHDKIVLNAKRLEYINISNDYNILNYLWEKNF